VLAETSSVAALCSSETAAIAWIEPLTALACAAISSVAAELSSTTALIECIASVTLRAPPTPRAVAFQNDFYTAELLDGVRDSNMLEDALANVENQIAPTLRKLVLHDHLTDGERDLFAYFMATMYLRVPHFRSINQQLQEGGFKERLRILAADPRGQDWLDASLRQMEEEAGQAPFTTEEKSFLHQTLTQGTFTMTISPEDSMRLLPVAEEWGNDLVQMRWTLVIAPEDAQFVTSDNPLVFVDITDPRHAGGLREHTTEITFALDRRHALLADWGGESDGQNVRAPKSRVREINRRTVRAAARFVYAPYSSTPLDRLVQQHVDTAPRPESTTLTHQGATGLEYLMHRRLIYGNTSPTRSGSPVE
jgi:hypothetical protein